MQNFCLWRSHPRKRELYQPLARAVRGVICDGVGGTFDVVAGHVSRAPLWMQKAGLEWLYRVLQEPGRMWKRYLITNSRYAWLLLNEK